jgi:hypothetical protein
MYFPHDLPAETQPRLNLRVALQRYSGGITIWGTALRRVDEDIRVHEHASLAPLIAMNFLAAYSETLWPGAAIVQRPIEAAPMRLRIG